ncbi:MAG: hypothetical protein JRI97_00280 [Deltaproteobacteria bacterium]|nr:hypothetical protein [Deltaproteobacteria bacterium]
MDDTRIIHSLHVIAREHGFELKVDLATQTFYFNGPEERRMELMEAISNFMAGQGGAEEPMGEC